MTDAATETTLEADARAAVTIGRPADELRALWLRPEAQSRIWAHFAEVTPLTDVTAAALATHRLALEDSPTGYHMFKHKEDGCLRAVFAPSHVD